MASRRQNIDNEKLLGSMQKWSSSSLIVLGDTIIDQYAACEALGMSAEAPVVVVRELKKRNFIGGAAVVASHIRKLGAKCKLISVVGKDDAANIVSEGLKRIGIEDGLEVD